MDTRGIEQLIGELRGTAQVAAGKPAAVDAQNSADGVSFAEVLKDALQDVSAATKEARSHLVAREVTHTSQAQFHDARMLCVFVDKDAQLDSEHCQRYVDDAFRA